MQEEDNKHNKILSLLTDKGFAEFINTIQLEDNKLYIIINALTLNVADAKIVADSIKRLLNTYYPSYLAHFSFVKKATTTPQLPNKKSISNIKHMIAISSGKGGVGKSTLSVNLAHALSKSGLTVGLLDADLYGPSVHFMLQGKDINSDKSKLPLFIKYNIYYTSIALLLEQNETPVMFKAPMAIKILNQLLQDTSWPQLDVLIIDLPPGTNDINLHLALNYRLSGIISICTPQPLAIIDMKKALSMYKKAQVPILGLIENMSTFLCPHCNEVSHIFDTNSIELLSSEQSINFLGSIPIAIPLRVYTDQHKLILNEEPQHPVSEIFKNIATMVHTILNKL